MSKRPADDEPIESSSSSFVIDKSQGEMNGKEESQVEENEGVFFVETLNVKSLLNILKTMVANKCKSILFNFSSEGMALYSTDSVLDQATGSTSEWYNNDSTFSKYSVPKPFAISVATKDISILTNVISPLTQMISITRYTEGASGAPGLEFRGTTEEKSKPTILRLSPIGNNVNADDTDYRSFSEKVNCEYTNRILVHKSAFVKAMKMAEKIGTRVSLALVQEEESGPMSLVVKGYDEFEMLARYEERVEMKTDFEDPINLTFLTTMFDSVNTLSLSDQIEIMVSYSGGYLNNLVCFTQTGDAGPNIEPIRVSVYVTPLTSSSR